MDLAYRGAYSNIEKGISLKSALYLDSIKEQVLM